MRTKPLIWTWIEDGQLEAEMWHSGGPTRATAITAARKAGFRRFAIAPCRPATRNDVRGWFGEGDPKVGDPIVDSARAEQFPARKSKVR